MWRERDRSATRAASTRSSRSPASAAATITFSLRSGAEAMSNPLPDDDQPLDPAAARMVARVRWLMLISGVTTLVAIAAVIGVIGYRLFNVEGSAVNPVEVTAPAAEGRAHHCHRRGRATASWSPSMSGGRDRNPHLRRQDARAERPAAVRDRAVRALVHRDPG